MHGRHLGHCRGPGGRLGRCGRQGGSRPLLIDVGQALFQSPKPDRKIKGIAQHHAGHPYEGSEDGTLHG